MCGLAREMNSWDSTRDMASLAGPPQGAGVARGGTPPGHGVVPWQGRRVGGMVIRHQVREF